MDKTDREQNEERKEEGATCNVSSSLNFTVGVVAILAALVIGYFIYVLLR